MDYASLCMIEVQFWYKTLDTSSSICNKLFFADVLTLEQYFEAVKGISVISRYL